MLYGVEVVNWTLVYTGLALWQFCDARTYVSSVTRPRGFNNKGTFDEFRRPKMAFRVVRDKLALACNH